jgi:hypothetical protein
MNTKVKTRIAGLLYLVSMATVFVSQLLIIKLVHPGDAAATAELVLESERLFRVGIVCDLVSLASYMGVMVILYGAFRPVSRNLSLLAAVFSLASGTVSIMNALNRIAPLILLNDAHPLDSYSAQQLQDLSSFFFALSAQGVLIALIFFGLHNVVIGWLIVRSRFYPRVVGVLLAVGATSYVVNGSLALISPELLARLPFGQLPGFGIGDTIVFFWAMWLLAVGLDSERLSATLYQSDSGEPNKPIHATCEDARA